MKENNKCKKINVKSSYKYHSFFFLVPVVVPPLVVEDIGPVGPQHNPIVVGDIPPVVVVGPQHSPVEDIDPVVLGDIPPVVLGPVDHMQYLDEEDGVSYAYDDDDDVAMQVENDDAEMIPENDDDDAENADEQVEGNFFNN